MMLQARGGVVAPFLIFLFSLFILAGVGFALFGVVVPPGMFGVRQINFGPFQGFSEKGLLPGYHWSLPFYSEFHLVPSTIQIVDFHRLRGSDQSNGVSLGAAATTFEPLRIQASGQGKVDIDVDLSLLVRFIRTPDAKDQKAGPAELMTSVGIAPAAWYNKIRLSADDALKRTLGSLAANDFYNPKLREARVLEAKQLMNNGSASDGVRGLREHGIEVVAILPRRFNYLDERLENAIFQKNLQEQEKALREAESAMAKAQAEVASAEARGDAENQLLKTSGEGQALVIRSEADLYEAKKKAEGDLLVAKARAEVDRLKAQALARGTGVDAFMVREMGPVVGSLKGGVVGDIDPYDLDAWMKKLSGRGGQ